MKPDPPTFERLLLVLSKRFIDMRADNADDAYVECLRDIVHAFGIDRSSLSQFVDREGHFHTRHSWAVPGVAPVPATTSSRTYPWALAMARAGNPIVFDRLDDLPPEAAIDKEGYRQIGLKSHIGQPILVAGEPFGILGFGCVRSERTWSPEVLERTSLLAQMFANVLSRMRRQEELDRAVGLERVATNSLASLLLAGPGHLDPVIGRALAEMGTFLRIDRVALC